MNLEYTGAYIIYDFLDEPCDTFKDVSWDKFTINQSILARNGCFQGIPNQYGDYPWLRCPSISTVLPVTDGIKKLADTIKTKLNYTTNIFKMQDYLDGAIGIAPHADKIIDLDDKTPIFIARFGATRQCILTHKKTKDKIEIDMPHNSLLVIPYSCNLAWKHHIQKDTSIKEPSYSVVLRNSITYKCQEKGVLYGANTPLKTKEYLIDLKPEQFWPKEKQLYEIVKLYNIENNNICDISVYKEIIDNCIYP